MPNPSTVMQRLVAPTPEERVEEAADHIKRMIRGMQPGDKLVIERHAEREPFDALITVQEITHR